MIISWSGYRGMHNSLFNTTQETATRLTLCLPLLSRPSTIDEIAAIDLTATYMKAFGFGQHNLHGDGPHALAEYDGPSQTSASRVGATCNHWSSNRRFHLPVLPRHSGMFSIFRSIAWRLCYLLSPGCSAVGGGRL